MDENEIMIEIKDEDLEELANIYQPYEYDLPHVYSSIKTCIKAKKIGMPDFVTLMSPEDCWRKDGTFLAIMPGSRTNNFVHSLDESGRSLVKCLIIAKKIMFPSSQGAHITVIFFGIHEMFCQKLVEALTDKLHLELKGREKNTMYTLRKEDAMKTTITIPPDVYIKELDTEDVKIINSAWPHRYPGSEDGFVTLIRLNGGYGIYLKSNNQLVSWVLLSYLGQLMALQTLEEHKRKGYGSLVTQYMSKRLAEQGINPFAISLDGNPSKYLFQKLGFKKLGRCEFIYF